MKCFILLAVLIFLQLSAWKDAAWAEKGEDFNDAIDELMTKRSNNSDKMQHWFDLYSHGKIAESDKVWIGILNDCKNREEIGDFSENINERCWFDERTKKVDAEKAYLHLFELTQKALGKEHRFVADLATFLATYSEARHDYNKALQYRVMDLQLHRKALGAENHQVLEAQIEVAHLLITMKDYKQAETYLASAIVDAKKFHNKGILMRANHELAVIRHATGKDADIRKYLAE